MSRTTRRLTVASLALALGIAGAAPAVADHDAAGGGILDLTGVGRIVTDELPVITDDVEGGVTDLLGGGLLDGLLNGLGVGPAPDLSIQPVPTVGGGRVLEEPRLLGGLLDGLLGLGSISESLAGRL